MIVSFALVGDADTFGLVDLMILRGVIDGWVGGLLIGFPIVNGLLPDLFCVVGLGRDVVESVSDASRKFELDDLARNLCLCLFSVFGDIL